MVTWENYEEYMMMHADGELQPHEEAELQAFLEEHPQLKAEMTMYERAILTPDMTQVYEYKSSLLKEEPAGKRIAFIPNLKTYGIAAGIAALIVLGFFALQNRNTAIPANVAKNDSEKTLPASPVNTTVAAPSNTPSADNVAATDNTPNQTTIAPIEHHSTATPLQPRQEQRSTAQHTQPKKQQNTIPQQPRYTEEMTAVAARQIQKQPVRGALNNPVMPMNVDAYAVAETKTEKTSWIDKLPITDEKKEQLTNVANTLTSGVAKASSLKESIADKSLSIRVENRRLIFSF